MLHIRIWLAAAVVLGLAPVALAQPKLENILDGKPLTGEVGAPADTPQTVVSVSARFTPPSAAGPAMLAVTATIKPGWHIYSLTQKPVAALPTTIALDPSPDVKLAGEFRPNLPPQVVRKDGDTFEQYEGEVTWQAPIDIRAGVDPRTLTINGGTRILACANACLQPHVFPFAAKMATDTGAASSVGSITDPNGRVTISGRLEPASVAPGSHVRLVIDAQPAPDWHVYPLADRDAGSIGKPTLIVLTSTSGFSFSRTTASSRPVEGPPILQGEPPQKFHEGNVAWTTLIQVPKDARPGKYPVSGIVGYQTCQNQQCDLPRGARFEGTITVGAPGNQPASLVFTAGKYGEAAKIAATRPIRADAQQAQPDEPVQTASLPLLLTIIGAGLLGGFLLNFMPCVLPVIGLKILSFAEQAGHSRAQILVLNLWYSLGLMSVFMVLAALASGASLGLSESNLGWGQQFSSTAFNVVMVAVVFVMALSFLDVWEIPIPGFATTRGANELAAREGAVGAFSKGVLATILSTPCSGPFLGPVLGFTLKQPPAVTFLVFASMGLGMSAPYLLIGAFPRLIRFLPKPGAWMESFKHVMGFVMLGTIVFLFRFMNRDYIVPTFAMMIGLWAGCWLIGRVSFAEPLPLRLKAWAQGAAIALVVGMASFYWLTPRPPFIPWRTDFSQAEVQRLASEGHTVLVDFTAEWCLTCKLNLATAIETDDVKKSIDENKVVPMLADWTDGSQAIQNALATLNSTSIPVLAIYPAGQPDTPIVLRDLITKQQVLDAIAKAGPSKAAKSLVASQ